MSTLTQQIRWLPSLAPNIVAYEIWISDTGIAGEYSLLTPILHRIPGSNWVEKTDGTPSYFFYDDIYIPYRYYRLRVKDQFGNVSVDTAPLPFQAGNDPVEAPTLFVRALNEDTGGTNNLQYITEGGSPIEEATIRVYKKINWDLKNYNLVVGVSRTNASGKWAVPVFAEPGETYTIVYHKPNVYGPDTVEITL